MNYGQGYASYTDLIYPGSVAANRLGPLEREKEKKKMV